MNPDNTLISQITATIDTWSTSYYAWAAIFYILCVAIIVLPALIAANLFGTTTNRVLAALTVIAGALVNWANLGVVAGNFEKGRDDLRLALMQYEAAKDNQKLLAEYQKARDIVRSWSPGIPQTSTKS